MRSIKNISSADNGENNIPYDLVRIGYACNARCLFCNVECLPEEKRSDDRMLRSAMRAALLAGDISGARIDISGGEPGLYKGLPALLRLLKSKNADKLEIQTNGICFDDPALAAAVADCGATSAFVSLHSHCAKTHDLITGVPGSYVRCLCGIDNLLRCGLEVILNPVLCSLNFRGAVKYVSFVAGKFPAIKNISLSVVQPRGRALRNRHLVPDYCDLSPYVKSALACAARYGIIVFNPVCGLPLCVGGWNKYADRCVAASLAKLGRVENAGKVYPAICFKCGLRPACGGVWPEYLDIHGLSGLKPVL